MAKLIPLPQSPVGLAAMLAADLGSTLDRNEPAVVNEDMINDAVRPQNG